MSWRVGLAAKDVQFKDSLNQATTRQGDVESQRDERWQWAAVGRNST
jgi:hypothetical protein